MKSSKITIKKNLTFILTGFFIFIFSSCEDSIDLQNDEIDNIAQSKSVNSKNTVPAFSPIVGLDPNGTSTLHRNENGITVNFKTDGLTPGYAYTLWWVIWNNPENCTVPGACTDADFANADLVNVEVLFAAGHVVGNNGIGNFSAHLNLNDDSESINALFGLPSAGGLLNAQKAEVHLVLRSHGPKIPGMVNEQINSYVGGCDDPFAFPPFTEIPDENGECGDIIAAIHPGNYDSYDKNNFTISTDDPDTKVDGFAKLKRSKKNIRINFEARNIPNIDISGHAVTLWAFLYRDINSDEPYSIYRIGGKVSDSSNDLIFESKIVKGESKDLWYGSPLENPKTDFVMIVAKTKGLASSDSTILEQQLTTPNGGCSDELTGSIEYISPCNVFLYALGLKEDDKHQDINFLD
ncbi:MAG: hypothetical protein ABFR32_12800 [Bacteroidota bacterium]